MALLFNIFHNYFVGYIAGGSYKLSSCPYVSAPECFTEGFKFHKQFSGCLALEKLYNLTYRHVGRNWKEEMDMIFGDMPFYDLNIICPANFPYQIPQPLRNVSSKDLLSVFRNPYYMILYIVYGMAGFPVILHTESILKSSPEGESFSLILRRRQ